MKIAVRGGHTPKSPGAAAIINELTEDRKVKTAVIKYLQSLGHTVKDVTPGDTVAYPTELNSGISSANNWGAELFVSIHFNKAYSSYNGTIGSEVCVHSKFTTAQRVVDKLGSLGFKNRGQKIRTDLGELTKTNMPAMIVEVCFVEATGDVALYKKLGSDAVGKAIAEGIAGKNVPTNPTPPPSGNKLFRVLVEGKQIGAYSSYTNALEQMRIALNAGKKIAEVTYSENAMSATPIPGPSGNKLFRVKVDGTQIGAYSTATNAIAQVEIALKGNKTRTTVTYV